MTDQRYRTDPHAPACRKNGPVVYTDREMLIALRRHAQGEPTVSRPAFERRRDDGDPSPALYERRFGSWGRALELAGLQRTEQPTHLQGATTKWTEPQMLDAIRRCLQETGSTALATYERWRRNQLDAGSAVPPAESIRFRLGSWSHATALACA